MEMRQPSYAFVDLYIGGFDFTPLPPQYLLNFNHVRNMADTANQFSFSVYDDTALELEVLISNGARDVVFRYGYTDGTVSKLYQAEIWDYKLEFQHGGVVLNVEGTSKALGSHAVVRTKTYSGMRIDQIVKDIAKTEGWKVGYIEPTVELKGHYDSLSSAQVQKIFHQQNIPATKFIKEELLPYAVSSRNGESGYQFYFDDKKGGPYLYFCPPLYRQKPKANYTLDYNKTGKGRIISFSPEVQGSVLMQGGGTTTGSSADPTSNNMVTIEYKDSSNGKKYITGSKSAIAFEKGKTAINMSGMTAKEMESKIASFWSRNANLTYPATLELLGSPDLDTNITIEIFIVTNKGKPHHTSGIYLVQEVTDDISSGGNYTTSCKLIKNAVAKGTVSKVGKDVNDEPAPKPKTTTATKTKPKTTTTKRYYVVKKGDSLWKIAVKYYKNGSLYTKILKANPQIKNPNLIKPGQKLLIP